jgi:UDP-N-acetylglucosamine--N-acetylmuramyl-(pentapeptide) pyrophosphoryl-undecaprenol N-acetylglucosamine transferase
MATAELCAWGIPAIVVPLPTAAADHQTANAQALERAGAAKIIRQPDLSRETLAKTIGDVLAGPNTLDAMKRNALARARPTAAADIARHILSLIGLTDR